MDAFASDEVTHYIRLTTRRFFPSAQIWLFGSRARRTNGPRSDYDFAIAPGVVDNDAWSRFWNEVDEHAPTLCAIELVNVATASPAICAAVSAEGISL